MRTKRVIVLLVEADYDYASVEVISHDGELRTEHRSTSLEYALSDLGRALDAERSGEA